MQASKAFGDRIEKVRCHVEKYDPEGRLLNEYFRERLFQETGEHSIKTMAASGVG